MSVSVAQLVKELRERTGAGMMDCKKALENTNNDMDKAIDWLRENGIAKAAKKGDRVAAEGLTSVLIKDNKAVIYELNSETDFVAKNEQFLALLSQVGEVLLNNDVTTLEEALAIDVDGDTLSTVVDRGTATIGEKINLRRFEVLTKNDDQVFASYAHMGGKISAVAIATGSNADALKNICMHVAASNPQFLNSDSVDPEVLEKEKEMLTKESLAEGKPANIVEKMIVGRIAKFLKEICLLDQPFVMNPDQTVEQFATANSLTITSFMRYEVGEGIEKQEVDFAAEVAAQARV